ncbi:MAG TPA: branched-chain amino acid ABC transporter substrate-binding protein [Chloroflexota bacterium]|nr:branched-chain amino acid ABC transporter substrate-binding protein [Chloroflexota bacterium]
MRSKFLSFLATSSAGLLLLSACGGGAAPSAAPASSAAPPAASVAASKPAAASTAASASAKPAASGAASAKPAASGATASGAAAAALPPGSTVTIGVELPMSGGEAANGVPTSDGVKLAVDQANAKSGMKYKYQVQILDDAVNGKHDPAQGAKNIQQFIADKNVMGVVGPFNSNVAQAEIPLTNEAGLVQISPANTNPDLTKTDAAKDLRKAHPDQISYFRVCTTDDFQGPAGADYAFKTLNKKAVFIVDDNETYGKGLADEFEKRFTSDGGKVLGHEHLSANQQDFKALLTKAKATNPDLIYYGGVTTTGGGLLRKQMTDVGMQQITMMGGDGIVEDEFIKEAGSAGQGTWGTVAAPIADKLPEAQDFIKAYNAKYTQPADKIGAYSASGYDAANIIIQAVENAGASRPAVRAYVAGLKDFKGALGTYGFDQFGDTTDKIISLWSVDNGAWVAKDQFAFK